MEQALGIDPGVGGCGCALFTNMSGLGWLLNRAAYVRNTRRSKRGEVLEDAYGMTSCVFAWAAPVGEIDRVLIEFPQVYRAGRGKAGADPNDLLTLAAIDGALTVALTGPVTSCESILPRGWKGTLGELPDGTYLPEQRIFGDADTQTPGILSLDEIACVERCTKSLFHNVVDGIGIGLHAVGRGLVNGRKRVIAR